MRKAYVFLVFASVSALIVAQGSQTVTGVAEQTFGGTGGNPQAGFNVNGWSGASYDANGSTVAFGSGKTQGSGTGSQTTGPNSAASKASSMVSSLVAAGGDGGLPTTVAVAVGPAQSNWANTAVDANNYAGGYNQSSANGNGELTGSGPQQASANGAANGKTQGSTAQGPGTAAAQASTQANSAANMSVPGATTVNGYGIVGGSALTGSVPSGSYAGGTFTATGAYNGAGGQAAEGSLKATGQSSGQVAPGMVSAQSSVSSFAQASGAGPAPAPSSGCGCGH